MISQAYEIVGGYPVINISELRHLITIQAKGPTSPPTFDEAGPVSVPHTVATTMASIEVMSGRDALRNGLTIKELFTTITMYWQPGILADMTVLTDSGEIYVIRAVENVKKMNVVLVLSALGLQQNAA
jgi:hypothetical protein